MKHFESCSAPICVGADVNEPETIWYSNELICTGHPIDKLHRAIRRVQKSYQKKDKAKGRERLFTYQGLKISAKKRLEQGARMAARLNGRPPAWGDTNQTPKRGIN